MNKCALALLLCMLLCVPSHAQDLLNECSPAHFGRAKTSSYDSFTDETGQYIEFEGVQFGYQPDEQAFVGVDPQRMPVAAIRFRLPKGAGRITLQKQDLALLKAVAYRGNSGASTICVLSPFSGVGSSGRFQRHAALIAIRKQVEGQKKPRIEGAIVKAY